jgi:urea transport system ATP-binding protein
MTTSEVEPVAGGNAGMGAEYLEVRGLTVDFDGFKAVSGVDLTLFQGDLRFLIGPNGAGKPRSSTRSPGWSTRPGR